ncbi:MAG: radical SAM family heme chaperone HemW [Odoribacteraceae bacterium]|jgi:oxygen-independent coproporphyrinogen-3 oxidase|nr:radical SAM family heme chaperone HemW [Odoribacteraceae bacterium]
MQDDRSMGIYVHVPFCRGKCFYCGFYSVASLAGKEEYLDAVGREIRARAGYLPGREVETLYFGGGTPSVLTPGELEGIVNLLEREYAFRPSAERTIEVNPEDINRESVAAWRSLGFNRLSVGVQSFSDDRLCAIHRRHSAREAIDGIRLAAAGGFDNIGIDLIVGLPGQSGEEVRRDIETLIGLPACHVSLYLLSIEPGTVFEARTRRGELLLPGDEEQADRFTEASETLKRAGFEHYEISNFARPGYHSRHNTAYWQGQPYIGLGPGAHSHDGLSRQWNLAHLKRYAAAVREGGAYFEREVLSPVDRYNEYVMTSLRTMQGAEIRSLQGEHAPYFEQTRAVWERFLAAGLLVRVGDRVRATEAAWLVSDAIFADLFYVSPE